MTATKDKIILVRGCGEWRYWLDSRESKVILSRGRVETPYLLTGFMPSYALITRQKMSG